MKFCDLICSSGCCLVLWCALAGCVEQRSQALDQEDVRIAGFYGDYLLDSGVVSGAGGVAELALLDSFDLNRILERHYLTHERLSRKSELYKRDPERWRAVVVLVRKNIRKKTVDGQ
ncbi:MAG: hypothetical protein WCI64_02540 [Chlorobium sp.]